MKNLDPPPINPLSEILTNFEYLLRPTKFIFDKYALFLQTVSKKFVLESDS